MKIIQAVYHTLLRGRRLRRLTEILIEGFPHSGSVLDLGCGNAELASAIQQCRPEVELTGIDVMMRAVETTVPVYTYDGKTIPFPDETFDYVMLVTVLHHTDDYIPVMKEALRVARKGIVLLDHQYSNALERLTLCIIDWPGNVPFGVYTPFNFKTRAEWEAIFKELHLVETHYNDRLYLFGKMFDFILGKRMHFLSTLNKS